MRNDLEVCAADEEDVNSSSSSSYWSSDEASGSSPSNSNTSNDSSISEPFAIRIPFLRQRRTNPSEEEEEQEDTSDIPTEEDFSKRRQRRRRKNQKTCLCLPNSSTILLIISVFIWCWVRGIHWLSETFDPSVNKTKQGTPGDHTPARDNLNYFRNDRPKTKKKDVEALPEGCRFSYAWQTTSFPTCNLLQELDLESLMRTRRVRDIYVSSGLWRDVFIWPGDDFVDSSFNQNTNANNSGILKLFKPEHPLDKRNMDRHRREALVMERLTDHPNILNLYGYCGTTILMEKAFIGLDQAIRGKAKYIDQRQKVEWALEAAQAVAALEDLDVIHADLQTQQFLVSTEGRVKLNDFNRCRFLPRNNSDASVCEIQIPSAPGSWRSPEEYNHQNLTTAMDVYSLGNVLHDIWIGRRPFGDLKFNQAKEKILQGELPMIPIQSELEREYVNVVHQCLQKDPVKRIRASEVAARLRSILLNRFELNG